MASEDFLLTVPQVAKCAQVNPPAVYRWIAQGQLGAVRIGRTIRVRASQVEQVFGVKPTRPEPQRQAS